MPGYAIVQLSSFYSAMKGVIKMNEQKLSQQVIWTILMMLLLVGCGSPAAAPTPTSEPLPAADYEVTFDGNGCTVTGPAELPAGEYTFNFIDQSDTRGELWLVYLEEGKTFQDHLDLQSEPGEWYPKPSWVSYDFRVSMEYHKSNGISVVTYTWRLNKVGEHTILCYMPSPEKLWFVVPLMIVENPSE
jgi:hypothetical protein